ncbi:MAG: hypothetical protein IKD29_04535 [Lentisphaeria bacterium]|nr:hypothetical protein [Lentisphaeria bacterium]
MAGKEKASRKVKKALDSKERIELCLSEIRKMEPFKHVTCGYPIIPEQDHAKSYAIGVCGIPQPPEPLYIDVIFHNKKTNAVFSSLQLGEYDFSSRRDKLLVRGKKRITAYINDLPGGMESYNIKVTGKPEKLIVKVEEFLRTLNTK